MAFNITGIVNQEEFFVVNTAIHVSLFCALILPAMILCVVSIAALIFAKDVNWPVKVLLINILAADLAGTAAASVRYMAYPLRAYGIDENGLSCKTAASIAVAASTVIPLMISFYSITVYIFIKCGDKKLQEKFYITGIFIFLAWLVSIIFAVLEQTDVVEFGVGTSNGFCVIDFMQMLWILIPILVLLVGIVIILTFSILTWCYIRNNTINEGKKIKKAVAKILIYLWIKGTFILLHYIIIAIAEYIQPSVNDQESLILLLVTVYLLAYVLYDTFVLLTPILSLILLKPLQDVLKGVCTSGNQETPPTSSRVEGE